MCIYVVSVVTVIAMYGKSKSINAQFHGFMVSLHGFVHLDKMLIMYVTIATVAYNQVYNFWVTYIAS